MPETTLSAEVSEGFRPWGIFGNNVGNFLFSESLIRALHTPDTEIVPDSFGMENAKNIGWWASSINNGFDAVVLPMANAFRSDWMGKLNCMTALIRKLKVPVVVVGIGAQQPLDADTGHIGANPRLDAIVKGFVSAVLEKSARIGVRGEITASYLEALGFGSEHVEAIGCPSMYVQGGVLNIDKRPLDSEGPIAFNTARSARGAGDFIKHVSEEFPNSDFVCQTIEELRLLLWGDPIRGVKDPNIIATTQHQLYKEGRVRFFLDPSTWISFMKERQFSIGTRMHGGFAAILAGTPAFIGCFDSRTLELSRFHAVPHQRIASLADLPPVADVYESADFGPTVAAQRDNFSAYLRFLEENGLQHVWMPGMADPSYEELLSRVVYPTAVEPLGANMDALVSRIAYLREGGPDSQARASEYYVAPFAEPLPETTSAPSKTAQAAGDSSPSVSRVPNSGDTAKPQLQDKGDSPRELGQLPLVDQLAALLKSKPFEAVLKLANGAQHSLDRQTELLEELLGLLASSHNDGRYTENVTGQQ